MHGTDAGPAPVVDRHRPFADRELHVFSVRLDRRAAGARGRWAALRAFLGQLMDLPEREVPLRRDAYGRPELEGSSVDIAVCPDERRQFVALAGGSAVAVSGHGVPSLLDEEAFLPFSRSERLFVDEAPEEERSRRLAQLWTRKEASLRLSGHGRLALAGEVDALIQHREGRVLLPPASGGGESADPPVAYVYDVPAEPGLAASVATSSEMRRVFVWQVGDRPPVMA